MGSKKTDFTVYYQNVRGLRTKLNDFSSTVTANDFDVLLLTETSLHEGIHDNELGIPEYYVYRGDRSEQTSSAKRLGGALIAAKKWLVSSIITPKTTNIESVYVKISFSSKKILFVNVYIPPLSPVNIYEDFLAATEEIIQNDEFSMIFVTGDFNLPNINWESDEFGSRPVGIITEAVKCVSNFIAFMNFQQVNTIPNATGGFLDLILTNNVVNVNCVDFPLLKCDKYHPALSFNVNCDNIRFLDYDYFYYDFNNANYILINQYLGNINWDCLLNISDVNQALISFYEVIYCCIDLFVPKKRCKTRKFPRYYSLELKNAILRKKAAHKKFKQSNNISDYKLFSDIRKECKILAEKSQKDNIKNLENSMTDSKQFWSYIHSKYKYYDLPNNMSYNNNESDNPLQIADLFKQFFAGSYIDTDCDIPSFYYNKTINIGSCDIGLIDVVNRIEKLNLTLSYGPDEISPSFIYNCRFVLSPVLLKLFKISLSCGVFPEEWKKSYITPIFKSGNRTLIENYRPISKISIFSKIFESIVASKIYFPIKNIIIPEQHGFMSGRSTTTNLMVLEEFILNAFREGAQVDVIYTDFSKAFDRVNIKILIKKLEALGIHGSFLEWLESYLTDRRQAVKIKNGLSGEIMVKSGVPQGGHMSTILFICFINDIPDIFEDCMVLLYADDLKIFRVIENTGDCVKMQNDLNNFTQWCDNNNLALNLNKCKVMRFYRGSQPMVFNYSLNNSFLEPTTTFKDLGVFFDTTLSFRNHYDFICNKALKLLGFLKRSLADFSNIDCFKNVYCSLVRSVLEYSSSIWSPFYKCYIDNFEKIQKKFLRFVAYKLKIPAEQIVYLDILKLLNIPTLENRRIMLDLIFLFKIVNGMIDSPELLQRIILKVPQRNTRCKDLFHLEFQRTNYCLNRPIRRMCQQGNSMDVDFFSMSLNSFKRKIRNYYK